MKKIILIFFVFLLPAFYAVASAVTPPPVVHATFKSDSVLIGDQFLLEITINKDLMQMVEFPSFLSGEIVPGIEVVSESETDTIQTKGRTQTLKKEYNLTSFQAGIYKLDRFPVLYGDKNITDTLYSTSQMEILVANPQAEGAEAEDIKDIKAPEQTPLLVSEVSGYAIMTFLLLCIIAATIYTTRRTILKRNNKTEKKEAAIVVPSHVRAIHDLEALHNQKLWQSGHHKQYYTRLTDIVRLYLHGRFGINAMEMTSEEIINDIKTLTISQKQRSEIGDMLRMADLAKFAKFTPEGEQNESIYYKAYYFIEETKETAEELATPSQNIQNNEK